MLQITYNLIEIHSVMISYMNVEKEWKKNLIEQDEANDGGHLVLPQLKKTI